VILALNGADEVEKFLVALCTPQEIKALKERWEVCQLLNTEQLTYRKINEITGASTATITRVARFLKNSVGYRIALDRLGEEKCLDGKKCRKNGWRQHGFLGLLAMRGRIK
jgi:TrpR-related protein YerC/YecD